MTLEHISFYGRPALQLVNDVLSVAVVPELGGRVMSLRRGGENYFWTQESLLKGEGGGDPTFGNWMNWGGYKIWLAPQDSWPGEGAPSLEMDQVAWEVVKAEESVVELQGPVIPWAGVRLGRRLSLKDSTPEVLVREWIENVSDTPRTWSVWAVAQFPVPGWATYPTGERVSIVPPIQTFEVDRLRFTSDAKWKMGAYAPEGWAAYKAEGWEFAFKASFEVYSQGQYPNKVNIETWSNTSPDYMELEWLGPSVVLEPGERWDWETVWRVG